MNDHVVARYPIDWSGHLVLVTSLQRVYYSKYLCSVPACRCRICQYEPDDLLWVDDKDGAHCERQSFLIHVRDVLMVQPDQEQLGMMIGSTIAPQDTHMS